MKMIDIIEKKKNGEALSKEEIEFFVNGYNNGEIPDYQMSSLLMAICLKHMTTPETANLTMAMSHTGESVDLSFLDGVKVDKHSSGGVGDKTTLVVGPMVAACGLPVAKMSGRGLGFSGGTIDKLETIPGFETSISQEKFVKLVTENKICVMGQSLNIAPADKKIYALRDVTGTVDNVSLIASSIMSKKLASGSDAIVLDVKVGSGAFMKTMDAATELATEMVNIGEYNGRKVVAVITNMDEPLGFAVGNSLEVIEAIDSLHGNGPKDFMEVCYSIASAMLVMGKKASNVQEARAMLQKVIDDGTAFEKFVTFVESQGGDGSYVLNPDKFEKAKFIVPVKAKTDGVVSAIYGADIGYATLAVGAGRYEKTDEIDPAVGAIIEKKIGDAVKAGDVLAWVHANDEAKAGIAVSMIEKAYTIGETAKKEPAVRGVVCKDEIKSLFDGLL